MSDILIFGLALIITVHFIFKLLPQPDGLDRTFAWRTLRIHTSSNATSTLVTDVGDAGESPVVTSSRCWCPICNDSLSMRKTPTSQKSNQYHYSVTNIRLSPAYRCHQHHCNPEKLPKRRYKWTDLTSSTKIILRHSPFANVSISAQMSPNFGFWNIEIFMSKSHI